MLKILLISILSFSLSASLPFQFINAKNGLYVKNNTNRYIYCFIGQYEFKVKPLSNSRIYPNNKQRGCK